MERRSRAWGTCSDSAEHLVGYSKGVHRVRYIRRIRKGKKFNNNIYTSFKSTPWNPKNDGKFYPQFILPDIQRTSRADLPRDSEQQEGDQHPAYEGQPEATGPSEQQQQEYESMESQETKPRG